MKGIDYFKKKDIYVRAMLRNNPIFTLSIESEECLKRLLAIQSDDPYIPISQSIGTASVVQDLANKGFIQLGTKGISLFTTGGFVAVVMILPKGRAYFQDKADYIEEILTFPQNDSATLINISSGDNSPIQVGTINSTQSVEYNFDLAQDALNEIFAKIDELGLKLDEKQDLLENIAEAQKLVKEKKKGPLKTILKGIWEVIKDVGCSVASSLIISQLHL